MKPPEDNDMRPTLFENPFLEKLTVVSVSWFIATWAVLLPLIALAGWGTVSVPAGIGLVLAGMFIWTLFEYVAHRYLFHWDARWPLAKAMVYVIHGNHHEQPRDTLRNLMPPIVSVPVGLVVWAAFEALIGAASAWLLLGFMSGYVMYDLTHYACHQWPLRSRIGRMLKRHHMRHHFVNEDGNFAITAIFWDRVFGSRVEGVKRRGMQDDLDDPLLHPAE